MRTLYKLFVVIINHYIGRDLFFRLIGYVNRKYHFLNAVFVAYPASREYTYAYGFRRTLYLASWTPWITGIYIQNRKLGLMTCITTCEEDFLNTDNNSHLKELVAETERIRLLTGAYQKTFAGILPGILFAKRILTDATETDVTVEAVQRAAEMTLSQCDYPHDAPLIILGGKGFVGRRLLKRFNGRQVFSVDINGKDDFPEQLHGSKALLINVSRKAAIADYIRHLWSDLIILNEVYPPPVENERTLIASAGCKLFHVVGVEARSYPDFPGHYKGGIPCCAAWNAGKDLKVLIRRLA